MTARPKSEPDTIEPLPPTLPRVAQPELDAWLLRQRNAHERLRRTFPKQWKTALEAKRDRQTSYEGTRVHCSGGCGRELTEKTEGLILDGGAKLLCAICKRAHRSRFGRTSGIGL